MGKPITFVEARIGGPDGVVKRFKGRFAWTLDQLVKAGKLGITPLDMPAPRWSHYVFVLRREGVPIETIEEKHDRKCISIFSTPSPWHASQRPPLTLKLKRPDL